ncbi:hypothetical protein P4H42_10675 [Paenibacillus macerans]|uniref:hypothetical protein n=2 Tax=Paenibacillus TaxID=44249 RepID=UPI002DBC0243|nr:hypothetical protein [Paenibacillus macerans]MEC0330085.1 hypothetical protein [Paenibacillus macerans]
MNRTNYVLSQDEWFYLCLLSGATTLFGLENVPDGLDLQDARQRWEKVSGRLKSKHILTEEDEDQLYIERDYAAIAEILSFPDQVFACLVEKNGAVSMEFIHCRAGMFTRLTGEETCEVQLCTGREEAIAMLRKQFLLSDCEQEAFYPLPAAEANYALALAGAGEQGAATVLWQKLGIDRQTSEDLAEASLWATVRLPGHCRIPLGFWRGGRSAVYLCANRKRNLDAGDDAGAKSGPFVSAQTAFRP